MRSFASGGGLTAVVGHMSHADAKVSSVRCHAEHNCTGGQPCSPYAHMLQVRVAAVGVAGSFARESSAFRDACVEDGVVDRLLQVRLHHQPGTGVAQRSLGGEVVLSSKRA